MCLHRKTDLFQLCGHNFLYSLCCSQFQNRLCAAPPPPGIWLVFCSVRWGVCLTLRPTMSGIWLSSQNAGHRRKQKDLVILSFLVCTAFTDRCSYIHCFVGAFESLWKSLLNVGCLEWTTLWKWRNRRKTAFRDLRWVFRLCLVRYLNLNENNKK